MRLTDVTDVMVVAVGVVAVVVVACGCVVVSSTSRCLLLLFR